MGKISKGIGILLILFMTSGCATIINSPSQKIPVSSNPSGARVEVDGTGSYKTPITIKLERKRDHVLIVSKEGHEQEQVVIMHVISGAVAGNILAGGLIGWGVDAMTGAQYKLVPGTVHVELKPLKEGASELSSPLVHMTTEDKLKRLNELLEQKLITEEEHKTMKEIILKTITE